MNKPIAIEFPACGAELHPAFSSAKEIRPGVYRLDVWVHAPKNTRFRRAWAADKLDHLRSFGAVGTVIEA